VAVLSLSGEIDVSNASAIVESLCEHLVGPGHTIQVALSEVTFMDSSGIGACLKAQRRARLAGYDIVFSNPSAPVALVIEILGLEQVLSQGLAS
jgi:anti-sigma B factor antagonist